MAIYERAYRGYAGPVTPSWSRFLVLPRYAFEAVFASKLFTSFFALCFLPSIVGVVLVYLHHNLKALTVLDMTPDQLITIDARFFLVLLTISALMLEPPAEQPRIVTSAGSPPNAPMLRLTHLSAAIWSISQ